MPKFSMFQKHRLRCFPSCAHYDLLSPTALKASRVTVQKDCFGEKHSSVLYSGVRSDDGSLIDDVSYKMAAHVLVPDNEDTKHRAVGCYGPPVNCEVKNGSLKTSLLQVPCQQEIKPENEYATLQLTATCTRHIVRLS